MSASVTLQNGVVIPQIGLGTWLVDQQDAAQVVRSAIEAGYRHIDTAQAYGNECGVGQGVRDSGIAREDIFVTTKLAAEIKDYEMAQEAIDESLRKLNLDYIDLMLIHSPQPWDDFRGGDYFEGNRQAWKALEEAYQAGKIRAIGVSNFEEKDLENIMKDCTVVPMVNQVLCHVGNTPSALITYCQERDIAVEAYSPVAHGEILSHPVVGRIAEQYGVSIAQLCIAYTLQLGTISLPKTQNPDHMAENLAVDIKISDQDMETLMRLNEKDNYGESAVFPCYRAHS